MGVTGEVSMCKYELSFDNCIIYKMLKNQDSFILMTAVLT